MQLGSRFWELSLLVALLSITVIFFPFVINWSFLQPHPHVRKWPPTTLRVVSSPFRTPARLNLESLSINYKVPWGKNSYCFS